jgi:hypothetical protein
LAQLKREALLCGYKIQNIQLIALSRDSSFSAAIAQDTKQFEARNHNIVSLEKSLGDGKGRQIMRVTDYCTLTSQENTKYKCLKTKGWAKYLDFQGMEGDAPLRISCYPS